MRSDIWTTPATTVDEYLNRLPESVREVLQKLRQTIRKAAPEVEEVISYQIPTYKYKGALVHFAAYEKHCSFFVVSKDILKMFEGDLADYKCSGTTIHFTVETPLKSSLVQKIVKTRVAQNDSLKERAAKSKSAAKKTAVKKLKTTKRTS